MLSWVVGRHLWDTLVPLLRSTLLSSLNTHKSFYVRLLYIIQILKIMFSFESLNKNVNYHPKNKKMNNILIIMVQNSKNIFFFFKSMVL